MKCICGSGTNETIKDLMADCQTLHIHNLELQGRVTALRELWGASIKRDTELKAKIRELEEELENCV